MKRWNGPCSVEANPNLCYPYRVPALRRLSGRADEARTVTRKCCAVIPESVSAFLKREPAPIRLSRRSAVRSVACGWRASPNEGPMTLARLAIDFAWPIGPTQLGVPDGASCVGNHTSRLH